MREQNRMRTISASANGNASGDLYKGDDDPLVFYLGLLMQAVEPSSSTTSIMLE